MKLAYRPEIDGLRAIAVSVVILYHAQFKILGYQPFKGGFIGVDIFFVISGYLITSIILKELITTGSFSFKHFYERRIRRILPALLLVMLVSLSFAWMCLLPSDFIDFSKSILYSLGFSSNFYFWYSGQQYGAEIANFNGLTTPLLHTWSLSVEEQYYIIFPLILLIIFKYLRKYLIHILILGFVISLGLADWGSRSYPYPDKLGLPFLNPTASFYFLHARMWELLAGSILSYFEITLGHRSKHKTLNLMLPSIGLFLIGYSILFFNNKNISPAFYTLLPIIGVCLIIWFSNKDELITKILSSKLFVGVGLISYSLYLWHYVIFAFLRYYGENYGKNENLNFLVLKFSSIFLIIIISILTYFFIEKVFRSRKINFNRILTILFLNFLLLIILNLIVISFNGFKSRFHHFVHKYEKEHINFKLNYNYNNFDNRKNIFIVGNSYSDDLLNLFYYNKELNKKYYFYTALADNTDGIYQLDCLKKFLEKKSNICDGPGVERGMILQQRNYFNFFKTQYEKSDYIILSQRDNNFYLEPEFNQIVQLLKNDKKKFLVLLNNIEGASILVYFVLNKKRIPDFNKLSKLESEFFKKNMNYQKEIIFKVKNKFEKYDIKYLTRSELYCDHLKKKCPLVKNNNKLYSDNDHHTDNGAKYFSNQGEKIMDKLIN